jgi:hypothetical protein
VAFSDWLILLELLIFPDAVEPDELDPLLEVIEDTFWVLELR